MRNDQRQTNLTAIAGEFSALSRLAIQGYDANMTLGNTKNVDILVSDPITNKMYQLEVKSKVDCHSRTHNSQLFGQYICSWVMHEKHETIKRSNLFYCFISFDKTTKVPRYFVVPSSVVAEYVSQQHQLWMSHKKRKETTMREFRIGLRGEKYKITTPVAEDYEDNWKFNAK